MSNIDERTGKPKIILDLCGGSGSWSRAYAAAGYDVRNITLPQYDVLTYEPPDNVYGILAAPPCTEFSVLNCKAEARKRNPQEGLKIVMACLRIIEKSKPVWWALENPVGFLREYMGKSALIFHPWQYGDPWTKRTELWGTFTIPEKKIHELGRCSKQATSLHQTGTGKTKFCLSPQIRAGPYTTACLGQPENRRRFSGDYSSGICASVF